MPKGKQLYSERSAGKAPDKFSASISQEIFDEALARLGAADPEQLWWRVALAKMGGAVIKPDWFKRPYVQEWLSQTEVKCLLKEVAQANLVGSTDHQDTYERLIESYIQHSYEDRQHAESVISLAVAVLNASIKGAARDPGTAALVQATAADQRGRLGAIDEKLQAMGLGGDLKKLVELAKSYADLIPDDIGGTHLNRPRLLEGLDSKLSAARLVQVRGLPGSGKSVVVKHAVKRAIERGPALFLKAEQLEGNSWISYAASQGLSGAPLEQLLVEVGRAGTPILFIDAIDRVEKKQQPVILDVIRVIVESTQLSDWRVVVSLRDTGIEVLRNWLGDFLAALKVETLAVEQLSDEEAEALAEAKPHLRPLLFGSAQVKEVVRRPFFAKVLHKSYMAAPTHPAFAPQSEVDLIANWWRFGGYNETGQSAFERQRALLDLARTRARQLSQPIGLGQLNSLAHINDLISDGVLQHAREGISVRFAHDIFFEWAFFHVLADRGELWMEEIKACGEPPTIARVVELASQWEYIQGEAWSAYLALTENTDFRSQWQRAWLVGPIGTAGFDADNQQFAHAVFADDFRLFRKALVWFQAEKTSPNPTILSGAFPQEQLQRAADLLGWPSDFAAWRRLIDFILRQVSGIPQRLYPEIVSIFQVWQNALADHPNPTSRALLQLCARWLADIDALSTADTPNENSRDWRKVPHLGDFKKSLVRLILRASRAEPNLADNFIRRMASSERIDDDVFSDITAFAPVLAQSLPASVVELSLAFLRRELPNDQVAREELELHNSATWRNEIQAKPEAERTRREQMALSCSPLFRSVGDFSRHDWERLSIHDDHQSFWPSSPLREPFHSLFQFSPDEGLRLFRELCNHAMLAWQQLHVHSHERVGTPIPLELTFPWGTQYFWGSDREYLWCRSTWEPKVVGCGFMALEEWCFAELARGRPVEELIQKIVEGNECIAILGTAAMLTLHTEQVSEATIPLFTSQRLLAADHHRMAGDLSSAARLIGFTKPSDKPHFESVQAADARPVRKSQLSWMVPKAFFAAGPISDTVRNAIRGFQDNLPFQYEEQRSNPEVQEDLAAQALEYSYLVDPKNYQAYCVEEDPNRVAMVHVSPSAAKPENITKTENATRFLTLSALPTWASKSFESGAIHGTFTITDAIALGKEADCSNLYELSNGTAEDTELANCRGAVAAVAAMVLNYREGLVTLDLDWARDVLSRAMRLPEKPQLMWTPSAVIPWHQAIFAARGLAADLREDTAVGGGVRDLLALVAHPLEIVSLAAVAEACQLWDKDPKLTWSALFLAFSLCHVPPRPGDHHHGEPLHLPSVAQAAVDEAFSLYMSGSGWVPLPLPPPAWVKVKSGPSRRRPKRYIEHDEDASGAAEEWGEPDIYWHSKHAAEILELIPFDRILSSPAKGALLEFLEGILDWTNQKNSPPWVKPGHRDHSATRIFEWTYGLGAALGRAAGLLPLSDFQSRFLDPILELEADNCWALLSPFVDRYICLYVYDSPDVPADAVATLDLCLGRFLQDPTFTHDAYRSGELSGFDKPRLVRALMFVSIEHAGLAARYINGDWSEVSVVLPLIDRFIRVAGWAAPVMDPFLTLCERARFHYPAGAFADQVLATIEGGPDSFPGWRGTLIPARIAELVQHFAHRDAPMTQALAQKFLRILDILVDMGDRRSAALQLGEAFRETRLSP
ncbi:hypothetical protein [Stutzerimonas stutzeri]|uniref:hypothetical protein n=1 Tax=Stutzerimonas stutzeri TaxID=316 RepID=UPI001A9C858A|nr:hypothetical protein [Stutzerimonas stutzeri]